MSGASDLPRCLPSRVPSPMPGCLHMGRSLSAIKVLPVSIGWKAVGTGGEGRAGTRRAPGL